MSELNRDALEQIKRRAERVLLAEDRRQRSRPLMEAMKKQHEVMQTTFIPDLMAQPEARVRQSVLRLEQSLSEFPEREMEREAEYRAVLASARRRTAALRKWLDSLS